MKKKIVWLVVSCLMVLSLVLAACAPAVTEERKGITVREETEAITKVVKEEKKEVAVDPEVPRYGGTLILALPEPIRGWDEQRVALQSIFGAQLTNEGLLWGDWTKGPAGTNETGFEFTTFNLAFETGALAESWEIPDPNTVIFHIRKGVHYGLNPASEASRLVGGREVTAEDVAWNVERILGDPGTYTGSAFKGWLQSVETPDKYTVILHGDDEAKRTMRLMEQWSDKMHVYPPEVIEKYGDMNLAKNSVGTGPFMVTDHVSGSSATLVRNPNWWMKNPIGVGKGNQLPYIDGVKLLVIVDKSTRLAALRTGKLDQLEKIEGEDYQSLTETKPWLKSVPAGFLGGAYFAGKIDEPGPWADIRVRRAMNLGVNQKEIAELFYGGQAAVFWYPVAPLFRDKYISLEELPESTRELFEYHPDKARQLLAEAGYPDGLKTSVAIRPQDSDLMSIVKAQLKEVGIDLELKVLEATTHKAMRYGRTFQDMTFATPSWSMPQRLSHAEAGSRVNAPGINNPIIEEATAKIYSFENINDEAAKLKYIRDRALEYNANAYVVQLPTPYVFTMWGPWLMNYHGESDLGFYNAGIWSAFIWFDMGLRQEIAGR